ncbi:SWIM zinc finger family protein [Streptomyces pseudovenezuelae]|uniref:Zn finger protein/Arc/MetJ-type ribon-helix-helix transcriptional regulator n=1 Tax=Streptomyces pseudovenezuelae TaxID=67350 RepID=A0ABT6LBL0_9ACTN|nr:SWIM zinc finger family protein [Streptomyces pseudovenezuelae]MDH6213370.1 putative Zn finger protein/Arc/MetJ-type ribon-helix-helix transcriptional regulator [Streptomyces pseudovenezuelae]
MTPSPADRVRRALREAREAREGREAVPGEEREEAQAQSGPGVEPESASEPGLGLERGLEPASGLGSESELAAGPAIAEPAPDAEAARPGDAAREALRRAISARRGLGEGDPERAVDAEGDTPAAESTDAEPTDAEPTDVESTGAKSTGVEAGAVRSPSPSPSSDSPDDLDVSASGQLSTRAAGTRPADAVREALRAARSEARQARTDTGQAGAEAAARRHRHPAPPSMNRRSAGVQARDVRELLAGAFRMPDEEPEFDYAETEHDHNDRTDKASSESRQDLDLAASPSDALDPAAPRLLHSMAAPTRDGELRRTFPALPNRAEAEAEAGAEAGSGFAETWWGNAWVTALEEGALDVKRLVRGRSYAEQGHVDAITVTPGLVLAYVQGSRPRPYRVQVRLRTLSDQDWELFLDAAAERPGHIAALLDKELPHSLADCGVPLLPEAGDLEPHCSCPDRGHPCKHAAALCYQTARLLDADPFVLLLLRGRGERELLDALSRLSATRAARAAREQEPPPVPGVRASEAIARREFPRLPHPLPVPAHPEQPPVYPAAPGGPDPFALDQLATDAAARAHALLSTGRDPVAELTLWQDAVRLAAARPGSGLTAGTRALYASLATAADRTPADLARAVAAWRQGGPEGLAVLEESWDPPAGRFDRARPLLLAADLPAFRPWHNHLTHPRGHVQLRLGRDGLWYAYESEPGDDDWWPRGTPDLDPVGALTGLGSPNDL